MNYLQKMRVVNKAAQMTPLKFIVSLNLFISKA